MTTIIAKLFESVTFNSISCIPGLFLVLGMVAMYDLRKRYSRVYRSFSYVVIYYIQLMMIVKLCVNIYLTIETVNFELLNGVT